LLDDLAEKGIVLASQLQRAHQPKATILELPILIKARDRCVAADLQSAGHCGEERVPAEP
jgi:hypothetical protein